MPMLLPKSVAHKQRPSNAQRRQQFPAWARWRRVEHARGANPTTTQRYRPHDVIAQPPRIGRHHKICFMASGNAPNLQRSQCMMPSLRQRQRRICPHGSSGKFGSVGIVCSQLCSLVVFVPASFSKGFFSGVAIPSAHLRLVPRSAPPAARRQQCLPDHFFTTRR